MRRRSPKLFCTDIPSPVFDVQQMVEDKDELTFALIGKDGKTIRSAVYYVRDETPESCKVSVTPEGIVIVE